MENQNFDLPEDKEYSLEEILNQVHEEAKLKPVRRSAKKAKPDSVAATVLQYAHDLVRLLAVIVVISMLLFRVVIVSGPSMYNTLLDGDYLLVLSNLFYRETKAGDIVIISKADFDNGEPIVKRVIATEGQKVDIDFIEGIVYVDDQPLDEPYTHTPTNMQEGMTFPLIVEEGCIFVLGDNRNVSKDSRSLEIGLIDNREVLGKVLLLFLPGTHENTENRDFGRIGVIK